MSLSSVTAFNLKKGFEQNNFCSAEIIQYIFKRINLLNNKINAYVSLFEDEALLSANKLDSSCSRVKSSGSLQGIPLAISSNLLENGPELSPLKDALLWSIKEEGAIILGATSMPANNPWNILRTAGYTSGGAAAAVAAGMAPLAVSVDCSRSIIEAAAFCGILGLKMSPGTISKDNVPNNSIGLFSRNAKDCLLLFNALACNMKISCDEIDNICDSPYRDHKIAVIEDYLTNFCDEEIKSSIESSISILQDLGFNVDKVSLQNLSSADYSEKHAVEKLFEQYEVILTPSTPVLPCTSSDACAKRPSDEGAFEEYPLLSLPCGFSSDDLPIGLQLASDRGNDLILLEIAAVLEKKLSLSLM